MKKKKLFILAAVIFTALVFIFASASANAEKMQEINALDLSVKPNEVNSSGTVKPDLNFGKFPLYFIFNKGQVNKKAKFYAKASRYTLWLTKEGLVFDSFKKVKDKVEVEMTHPAPLEYPSQERHTPPFGHPSQEGNNQLPHSPYSPYSTHSPKIERDVSRLVFLEANKNPEMVSIDESKLKVNYFIGNDKSKWHCDVPTSQTVLYKSLYKDIDLKVYGIEKQIEYDLVVKPGGNPKEIRFEYKNVKGTRLDDEGNLIIETEFGELIHKKPVSDQKCKAQSARRIAQNAGIGAGLRACPKERIDVNVSFKKIGENNYGFEVGKYDRNIELIIDPVVLAYSTYLGGEKSDLGQAISVDGSGNAYVTGYTDSTNFPTLNQYQTNQPHVDAFDTKLSFIPPNSPPVAVCKEIEISADENCQTVIIADYVDGGSYDPDDDPITLSIDNAGPFSLGEHMLNLTVTDEQGESDTCQAKVTVVDTIPPIIESLSASPNVLWPVNHKMVAVILGVTTFDNCDPAPESKIVSVSSNEPVTGTGDGDKDPDWEITGDLTVNIRAERSGTGSGRVYTVTVMCTDAYGNSSTGSINITVPHDKR